MVTTQSLLQKADLTLSTMAANGGTMVPEQAKQFWTDSITSSNFLKAVHTQPMKSREYQIPKAKVDGWVLAPSEERTRLGEEDRSSITPSKSTLLTVRFKATASISYETAEDNIEGGTFISLVRGLVAEQAAANVSDTCVQGDTAITPTDKRTRTLKKIDGVLKRATSNLIDAGGARFGKTLAEQMYRKMPTQYRGKENLTFLTSGIAAHDYAASQANRQTQLGDDMMSKMADAKHGKYNIVGFDSFPENLGSGDKTNILFCDPKNIVVGMGKDIMVKWIDDPDANEFRIFVWVMFDVNYVHEGAVVKAINVLASAI